MVELGIGLLMLVPLFFMMKRMNVLGGSRAKAVDPGRDDDAVRRRGGR